MLLPDWAVSVFVAAFMAVMAVAWWGIKWVANRISQDIGEVGKKVERTETELGKKVERMEGALKHVDSRLWYVEGVLTHGRAAPTRARTEPPPLPGDSGADEI